MSDITKVKSDVAYQLNVSEQEANIIKDALSFTIANEVFSPEVQVEASRIFNLLAIKSRLPVGVNCKGVGSLT